MRTHIKYGTLPVLEGKVSPDPVHHENELQSAPDEVAGRSAAHGTGALRLGSDALVPAWKRRLDLNFTIGLCVLLAPLFAGIAIWIKLVSRGPVLFRQERIGLGGKPFTIIKFRSMKLAADTSGHEEYFAELQQSDAPMTKLDAKGDGRLIAGGGLLRALGFDELPQLLNVWQGDMSLVGPRPCLPSEAERYAPEQQERFSTLPGLTGYWQVNGKNRTTFKQMVEMDIHYARNMTLRMDIGVIFRTPVAIIKHAADIYVSRNAPPHKSGEHASSGDQ
jgi:lipopolysaccharide/colanic/teichoic acid biosynthesis glycosyltransferase